MNFKKNQIEVLFIYFLIFKNGFKLGCLIFDIAKCV
jgi:hypothetical protein